MTASASVPTKPGFWKSLFNRPRKAYVDPYVGGVLLGRYAFDFTKVAARDLPVAAAQGRDGATTVAGSLAACAAAGLDVFATGGIGGPCCRCGKRTDGAG